MCDLPSSTFKVLGLRACAILSVNCQSCSSIPVGDLIEVGKSTVQVSFCHKLESSGKKDP